jgi:Ca2+-binding RTX toxin-like protein
MSNASAFEQLMLEYINRARMDPQGEFDRFIVSTDPVQAVESKITQALNYFGVDLDLYQQQLQGLTAVAPLAWNSALNNAATTHSQLMISQDSQSHQLPGEAGLGTRISAAGYQNWNFLAENIFAYTESPAHGHAGFFIDWGFGPGGMQSPAGHRVNIMRENLTEVGIGVVADNSGATQVGPYVMTQDFGNRWDYEAQFVGVAYNDNDADQFYSMGEGQGGITVTLTGSGVGSGSMATHGAGGYQIEGATGLNTLTFSGGGLPASVSVDVLFGSDNVKVDLIDGQHFAVSADATLGNGAVDLTLLGQASVDGVGNWLHNTILGNSGDNFLWGNGGDDTLDGGAGNDSINGGTGVDIVYGGNGDDVAKGNQGDDVIHGGAGNDWIYGGKDRDFIDGNGDDDIVYGGLGNDTLHGGLGSDTMRGGSDHDSLKGNTGNDSLVGGAGDDWMHGGQHNDWLDGGDGADDIIGGKGSDVLFGGDGNDTLSGGSATDMLAGGLGLDILKGGDGNDVFDYDAISDSPAGAGNRDVIVGGFDNPGLLPGDHIDVSDIGLFAFLAGSAFSGGSQSELRLQSGPDQTIVQGDVDGDGLVDFEIVIEQISASSMGAEDFLGLI